jgi:hypothetical protein
MSCSEIKEVFFFEKKNQNTFARAAGIGFPRETNARRNGKKSFFQKRSPSFAFLAYAAIARAHGQRVPLCA